MIWNSSKNGKYGNKKKRIKKMKAVQGQYL